MQNLSPESWSEFVGTLVREKEAWDTFYRRYSRGGPHAEKKCNKTCKQDILCRLVTFDREDTRECSRIKEEMDRIEMEQEEKGEEWSLWNVL